jgi:hypothetical protein
MEPLVSRLAVVEAAERAKNLGLLVQPEAAPLLPSHSQLTDRGRRRKTHRFFRPAHERRRGRTDALLLFLFSSN